MFSEQPLLNIEVDCTHVLHFRLTNPTSQQLNTPHFSLQHLMHLLPLPPHLLPPLCRCQGFRVHTWY